VTLVVTLLGKKSIWMLTDRRLTYSPTRQRNDACKMLVVEENGGVAILGYAGLGASARNTEPSEWMNDVLRGQPIAPLEFYLGKLADAMKVELPPHLAQMPGLQVHTVLATALVDGQPRLYEIAVQASPQGLEPRFLYTRHAYSVRGSPPPHLGMAGSGAIHLLPPQRWFRDLRRLLNAFERGKLSAETVADALAGLNALAAKHDPFVSPECMVTWRCSGGGFQFYKGETRVPSDRPIPSVGNGVDIKLVVKALLPFMLRSTEHVLRGEPAPVDGLAIEAAVNRVHARPKRKL